MNIEARARTSVLFSIIGVLIIGTIPTRADVLWGYDFVVSLQSATTFGGTDTDQHHVSPIQQGSLNVTTQSNGFVGDFGKGNSAAVGSIIGPGDGRILFLANAFSILDGATAIQFASSFADVFGTYFDLITPVSDTLPDGTDVTFSGEFLVSSTTSGSSGGAPTQCSILSTTIDPNQPERALSNIAQADLWASLTVGGNTFNGYCSAFNSLITVPVSFEARIGEPFFLSYTIRAAVSTTTAGHSIFTQQPVSGSAEATIDGLSTAKFVLLPVGSGFDYVAASANRFDAPATPTPIPEPASLLLLGVGLLACRPRRRREGNCTFARSPDERA